MGKKNKFFIKNQPIGNCLLCDYKSHSKKTLMLHMKYSHSETENIKENNEPVIECGICKKKNCKMH